jgi:LuxR family maltose regulon positive regulatory protein
VGTTPLLATKLHAPRRRRELVSRSRVSDRLGRGSEAALTVVSAPAGFGKSTAVTEWLATEAAAGRATAWLSLDEGDDDPTLFWSYVVAALQTAVPGVGADALPLLESGRPAVDTFLPTLLNDLAAVPVDVVLVLDDHHVIRAPEVHEAMAFLVAHLPPRVHLVLVGRADPPLPLARLRARGEVVELRAADLRFTADEAATYLRGSMGLDLAAGDVDALAARTEGWIAALQLAALSMQGRDDAARFVASFAGDDRFVVDYLAEEVLERQPDDVRRFLLDTAVLHRLTGPLCDAVTGGRGGRAMLERLDRANLFIVPLDDRRRWYRYHHLFADVLRARLLDEDPDRVRRLHRRASAWFADDGDRAEAIAHAMAGDDPEGAARLIELAAPALRQARQEATLCRWLEALPPGLFPDRPVLSAAFAGARMATGDVTGAAPLLDIAQRWVEGRADGSPIVADRDELARLPAQVAMYRAGSALVAGDVAGTMAHAERIVELADPSEHVLLGAATALTGLAHWRVGDLEAARARYAEAVGHFTEAGFVPDVLGCSLALGDIQVAQGRLDAARATFEAGLEQARDRPGLRGSADLHVGLSELFLERGDLDGAARHVQVARELGRAAGLPQHEYRWRVATARLLAARGDLDGALVLLDEAERVYDTDFSPSVRPVPALRARLHLARGDLAAARRWASDRGLTADDELDYLHEFEHVTLARTLLAAGDARSTDGAAGLLDRLLAEAERGGRGSVVEILVLRSLAHHARGDGAAAAASREQALARAAPEGHVRVFLDEGPTMTALLRGASLHGVARDHARRVLAAGSGGPAAPSRPALVEELSGRELDVLRLLRSDLSGPDIARELLVSLNTLRTHTRRIYAKLGVNSRREAVRRAAELGL